MHTNTMDDAHMKQILGERFETLPKQLQNAILSVDFREELKAIAEKHELLIDQAGKLEDETVLVMMGFAGTAEFTDNLAEELGIGAETAGEIVADVNERIFVPIRGAMQELAEQHGSGVTTNNDEEETPPEDSLNQTDALAELERETAVPQASQEAPDDVLTQRLGSKTTETHSEEPAVSAEKQNDGAQQKPVQNDPYREPIE